MIDCAASRWASMLRNLHEQVKALLSKHACACTSIAALLGRRKHTRQDEASACEGSSKDQAPGVGMEHRDNGTEAAGTA